MMDANRSQASSREVANFSASFWGRASGRQLLLDWLHLLLELLVCGKHRQRMGELLVLALEFFDFLPRARDPLVGLLPKLVPMEDLLADQLLELV